MIHAMTMCLVLLAAAPDERVAVPHNPNHGFAIDYDGSFLFAHPGKAEGEVVLTRFARDGSRLRETFTYPQKFEGVLELMPTKRGLVIVDYESGFVGLVDRRGKIVWETRTRYPNVARLDAEGNPWFFFNSDIVGIKTSDSSEVEPVLEESGAEIVLFAPADIAPIGGGKFYLLDQEGGIHLFGTSGKAALFGEVVGGQRILVSKLGGVLVFRSGTLIHVSPSGKKRSIWQTPSDLPANIRHLSRAPDGRLVMAGSTREGGIVLIIDPEAGS
ncbi:MAG: hypothetical protein IH851_10410 [Armatimonadetes bacterium]|nr:hypothetical protein [Armatimonadota bacterium]